jgi:hypothetical protein
VDNVVLVFVISRNLFGMNSLGIFWGWDSTSWLAFLGERHRFSDILFGLGSNRIMGFGNIAFPVNQKISDVAGGAPPLFRADLMLSGVLFERQLDAQISFHTGPFHNSRCRDAFQDRPAFGILRPR